MVETSNPTIERAIDVVTREIEITRTERSAFTRFRSKLHDVEPVERPPSGGGRSSPMHPGPRTLETAGGTTGLGRAQRRVVEAYRATVLEMDHYEAEYGNPIHADVACEFGDRVAYMVFGAPALTAVALRHLREQAETAVEERERHVRVLERELTSLRRCDADLGDVETAYADCPRPEETPPDTAPTVREQLLEFERACEDVVTRRQDTLHSRRNSTLRGVDGESLNRYLYGQHLSVTCPVLYDAVSLLERIRTVRERCESVLAGHEGVASGSVTSVDD